MKMPNIYHRMARLWQGSGVSSDLERAVREMERVVRNLEQKAKGGVAGRARVTTISSIIEPLRRLSAHGWLPLSARIPSGNIAFQFLNRLCLT